METIIEAIAAEVGRFFGFVYLMVIALSPLLYIMAIATVIFSVWRIMKMQEMIVRYLEQIDESLLRIEKTINEKMDQ